MSSCTSSVVYLNGQYLPRDQARLDVEDRGVLFADGVYEVVAFFNGRALAMPQHLERMGKSLQGVRMSADLAAGLDQVSRELVARNRLRDADVYWQITRGPAVRNHVIPAAAKPTILAMAYPIEAVKPGTPARTAKLKLVEDQRWHQCWIKSLMLLPNVLAISEAQAAGFQEALLHRGDIITECSRTSFFMVREGELWTHPADQWILAGITRAIVIELAGRAGIPVHEEAFTVSQALAADEAFITGTVNRLTAIAQIDDRPLAQGAPGPVTARLNDLYQRYICDHCGITS